MLKLFLKTILLTILFSFLLVLVTAGAIGYYSYQQFHQFSLSSKTNWSELKTTFQAGWQEPVIHTNNYVNILILGIDSLPTRGEAPPLSDTIILASINLKDGQVRLLSFPRDLWIDEYQTKINTLLAYGQDRYPGQPAIFPQEVIEKTTGIPIHHTLILSMEQVSTLIDLVGGVEVNIQESFIDDQFPRTDVDIKIEHDPTKLYQRVEFVAGQELMNGERALQFMRSRHSSGDQGTDIARSQRQQQVILALVKKIQQRQVIMNPQLLGKLYRYYLDNFDQYLSITQLIAISKSLLPLREQLLANLVIKTQNLSSFPDEPSGTITHPKTNLTKYQNQWVYIIKEEEGFRIEVKSKLNP